MRTGDDFEILKPYEFLDDLKHQAKNAKKRIWIQAMYVRPGVVASALLDIFKNSTSQKIVKKLCIDWYDLMLSDHNRLTKQKEIFNDLKNMDVKVLFTNPPDLLGKIWPYKGRNHMKMTVIDNISYVGGLNFADEDFSYVDFMVKIKDPDITDIIADQFIKVEEGRLVDKKIQIDKETTLFVDSGKAGQSIILDHAIELAREAKKNIFHINQLTPDGKFLEALHTMYKKGVNVEVLVPAKNGSGIFSLVNKVNKLEMLLKKQKIPILFSSRKIHAKLTIVDEKTVLFGSHNLFEKGVYMGTAEISLQSTNQKLVQSLLHFYKNLSMQGGNRPLKLN